VFRGIFIFNLELIKFCKHCLANKIKPNETKLLLSSFILIRFKKNIQSKEKYFFLNELSRQLSNERRK